LSIVKNSIKSGQSCFPQNCVRVANNKLCSVFFTQKSQPK